VSELFFRRRAAVSGMFFANGVVFASWAARIPGVRDQAGLSPARMGLALLAVGVGTVAVLPVTSWVLGRRGSRPVVIAGAILSVVALALAGWARSLSTLVPPLLALGAGLGATDVAMNAQASLLEQTVQRSMMSSFHGLWSLGGLVGATLGGAFATRGWGPGPHFTALGAALVVLVLVSSGGLARDPAAAPPSSPLAWPSRAVARIGLLAACAALVEGGIADWSGLYLRDALGTTSAQAAAGFGAFSLAMMLGRFAGDRLIDRFGRFAMVRGGAALTAVALAAALLVHDRSVALVAFVFAGLGMCTVFPIAFSAAGRVRGPVPGQSIAAVATMAYGAGLLGPPAIGFVAGATSLPLALSLVVVAALVVALLATTVAGPRCAPSP
jgi:fucose permease